MLTLANEPSVALFRIQEHIRKTSPQIAEERVKACAYSEKLQGITFDIDNNIE